ncbi:MAG TPA: hypothetical protein VEU47_19160 [Candidatus Cybelea sp.]|nr:hypothetical protein [Candidatus Cybelea sp.]
MNETVAWKVTMPNGVEWGDSIILQASSDPPNETELAHLRLQAAILVGRQVKEIIAREFGLELVNT